MEQSGLVLTWMPCRLHRLVAKLVVAVCGALALQDKETAPTSRAYI